MFYGCWNFTLYVLISTFNQIKKNDDKTNWSFMGLLSISGHLKDSLILLNN